MRERGGGRINDFHSSTIYRDTKHSHSTLHGDEGGDHLHDFDLSVGLPSADMMAVLHRVLE